ncbi:aromatase/cyclase [Actinomadura rubrisoli]|uniref:Cyclase n=1 Tax=Actinomadura rubrisoli TaxID=2530368 RepID=A0A4R5AP74_9ACTN|nr:aromatase/cyclase [Actinomadura rubrisoli]TDD73459.1 cyclase [Actinomadura rubrisoli]
MTVSPVVRETEHTITVPAPADTVYDLIADAGRWPAIFTPTVHVQYLDTAPDGEERLRIWAFAGGGTDVRGWVSRRALDFEARRVAFRQTEPAPPVAAMRGEWLVSPSGAESSEVAFRHWFSAAGDDPGILDKIEEVVDRNSRAELDSLRRAAAQRHRLADLIVDFEDEVFIAAPARKVYDFLARAGDWPELIPHVARVELTEDAAGVQILEMDTRESAGDPDRTEVHTTVSARVLLPPDSIVYKQTALPDFLSAHVGSWVLREDKRGVTAVARHTVVLKEEAITRVLGPGGTAAKAGDLVRRSIGANSVATLRRARELTEGAEGAEGKESAR